MTPAIASAPPTMALKRMRGRRATMKISRSGLTPARTLCQLSAVVPIQGVITSTRTQNAAQGATTRRKRAADRPGSRCGDDIVPAVIGALEDSGGNFEDVIKMFGRKDVVRRSIRHDVSITQRNHTMSITGCQI